MAELFPRTGEARIVGLTGPPGVGKSTLIGAICAELRKADREVGVLSIDPSSPFTHGAVLGDRIRLSDHFLDPGIFIRSMATRGSLGGLAEAALQAALLMDASGKDDILLETVGVGQGEIDVVDHADTIVLALMPGLRRLDPGAEGGRDGDPRRDLRQQGRASARRHDDPRGQGRARARPRPRLEGPGGAHRGDRRARGSPSCCSTIDAHGEHIAAAGTLAERRARNLRAEVLGIAAARLRRELEQRASERPRAWHELLDRVVRREIDPATAARELLEQERDG